MCGRGSVAESKCRSANEVIVPAPRKLSRASQSRARGAYGASRKTFPSLKYSVFCSPHYSASLCSSRKRCKPPNMSSGKQALLIGDITHARKEWEECSSFVQLLVSLNANYGLGSRVIWVLTCFQTGVSHWHSRGVLLQLEERQIRQRRGYLP